MVKISKIAPGYRWALGLAGLGLSLLTLPDLLQHWKPEFSDRLPFQYLRGSLLPEDGAIRQSLSLDINALMVQQIGRAHV